MRPQPKIKILQGWLTTAQNNYEIEARYATKYSVLIVLKQKICLEEIVNLELNVRHNKVGIGPCKTIMESEKCSETFHIMPEVKFFNFEKLFFNSKIENLESAAMSLGLLINHKKNIDPTFKEYVSNLTYDLNIFDHLLWQMDEATNDEPIEVRNFVKNKLIHGLGADLTSYMETSLSKLEKIVSSFSEKEHEHHGYYFRRQLWNLLLKAPMTARTNLKPRGYNGDSEMMRMIYENSYQGDSTFGKILHKFAVEQPAAESVRNRRNVITRSLNELLSTTFPSPEEKIRIMSVACGPAIEISDILKSKEDCSRLHFTLLDQDQEALSEAESLIGVIERSLDTKISLEAIQESVRIMLLNPGFLSRWGSFHFIYSMGLFDYFSAPVAASVLKKLYDLLIPGGELAIGNLHDMNSSRVFMEYWCDWKIIYRNEEQFISLAEGLPGAQCKIWTDPSNVQMFLFIKKT